MQTNESTKEIKLEISLKRVQTFIFEVPRLKAMLGANALIGHTMRHELPALLSKESQGVRLEWPSDLVIDLEEDPLNQVVDNSVDRDDPPELYRQGILARDGGHFSVLFDTQPLAEEFLRKAEQVLAERLPGVLYDAQITPFPEPKVRQPRKVMPHETALLDLPVLQVCQETGQGLASDSERHDGEHRWQASSVTHRRDWGDCFYRGKTRDIIGLLQSVLYPDGEMKWKAPDDLAKLASGGYLALVHADGNGIGKRYKLWREKTHSQDAVAKEAHGEVFFHSMRVAVRRALITALKTTFAEPRQQQLREDPSEVVRPYEVLMLGGDDLLLICRADRVLDFARVYAKTLEEQKLADGTALTVAIGVAIAQKTYPLHRLHELAENLASSAKRLYRALPEEHQRSVIDWQVVTQSWFEDVAEARRQTERIQYQVEGRTESLLLTGRPYRVLGEQSLDTLLKDVQALDGQHDQLSVARSPLRSLRTACEQGRLMGEMAFQRLDSTIQARLGWENPKRSSSADSDSEKPKLWKEFSVNDETLYLNRALDIIDIREISHLGKKPAGDIRNG